MNDRCPVCNGPLSPDDAACPACGFKLLGTTQEFKPITLGSENEEHVQPQAKAVQSASMTVIRGPQVDTCYRLDDKILTVGRSPQCDIFLNDMTVSREHATIRPEAGEFVIKDSNSFNGIWINNQNVEEAVLEEGDIVQIGAFCLLFNK